MPDILKLSLKLSTHLINHKVQWILQLKASLNYFSPPHSYVPPCAHTTISSPVKHLLFLSLCILHILTYHLTKYCSHWASVLKMQDLCYCFTVIFLMPQKTNMLTHKIFICIFSSEKKWLNKFSPIYFKISCSILKNRLQEIYKNHCQEAPECISKKYAVVLYNSL